VEATSGRKKAAAPQKRAPSVATADDVVEEDAPAREW
jgi:hypothetical protein